MPARSTYFSSRRRRRNLRKAAVVTGLFALALVCTAWKNGPPPEIAFALILAYFVAIAGWLFAGMWIGYARRKLPPHDLGDDSPPPPSDPPEPSPAFLPGGPRDFFPLVAHAVPPGDSDKA